MRRVLVTRPEPGAASTSVRLAARGFIPVCLPLTRIVALAAAAAPCRGASAVVVASANAVRHAAPELLARLAGLPVHAVGEATGSTAQRAGLSVADSAAGDSERLVGRVAANLAPGSAVIVLCGRVRRGTLEAGLAEAGLAPSVVETYDTLPLTPSQEALERLLAGGPIDAVMLHSAFAARQYARLLRRGGVAGRLRQAAVVAISRRVADMLPGNIRPKVAASPDEEAMIERLRTEP